MSGRYHRCELEGAETRFGFLANQVMGWDSEFARLQTFTGMDSKFELGQQGIVNEISNRFLERERVNTSLLRYLHEQQAECASLCDTQRYVVQMRLKMFQLLRQKSQMADDSTDEMIVEIRALDAERCARTEALLNATCHCVQRVLKRLSRDDEGGMLIGADCSIHSLESFLRVLDTRVAHVRQFCSALPKPPDSQPAPVLLEWCLSKSRQQPRVPIQQIHRLVVAQVDQRKSDGDEEIVPNSAPLCRAEVKCAKERSRIVEWAEKRTSTASLGT